MWPEETKTSEPEFSGAEKRVSPDGWMGRVKSFEPVMVRVQFDVSGQEWARTSDHKPEAQQLNLNLDQTWIQSNL